jgi:hypothetical protein
MGWALVGTGDPDVSVAVPAVVAGNPDIVAVYGWRLGDNFDGARRRRTDADNELCVGRADGDK